jgi:predicted ATPase
MAALDYITIQGFKSIGRIEKLELARTNILIGSNGSGKSNFIGAFSFLHAIREGRLQRYVAEAGGAERLLHFGSRSTDQVRLEIGLRTVNRYRYEVTLIPTDIDELVSFSESVWYYAEPDDTWTSRHLSHNGKEAGISRTPLDEPMSRHVWDLLSKWRVYHFHDTSSTSPMKKNGEINDNRSFRSDAANLAPYLFFLADKHPEEYGLIRRVVQRVTPFFDDFKLTPLLLNEDKIRLEWRHADSDAYFDASSLSDGTLRFIALATLLIQPVQLRPSVILIDEPELGLHPFAITMLASLINQAATHTGHRLHPVANAAGSFPAGGRACHRAKRGRDCYPTTRVGSAPEVVG